MSPVIRISNELHKRLEKYAVGFDNPASVIERLLNQIEGADASVDAKEIDKTSDILPIKLEPKDTAHFKQLLLEKGEATIQINYVDGRQEIKPWKALRFTEDSDVIGNLRTRKMFRPGRWQSLGIKDVLVSIDDV